MLATDIAPQMRFAHQDLTSFYFEVREVVEGVARGEGWRGCTLKGGFLEVRLSELVDESRWRYLGTQEASCTTAS